MDFGTVLCVAQTLFAALSHPELKKICSNLGYKSELMNLEKTISTVKRVLLDAEAKQELSNEAQLWVEELKDTVYDADDLLDEFITLAEKKQLLKGGKVTKEVRRFFSRYNQLGVAYNMSQGVKKIRKKLDVIASNHDMFGFSIDYQPIRRRRDETCSYVHEQNIIGRENDREKILDMLLDSIVQEDVSFLTIVGIGGLGKTSLAQLVYNDERVKNAFTLRLWASVSDQDQKQLDVKAILVKILESATNQKYDGCTMDRVQSQLRDQLAGRQYFLVLDDVWNESRDEWLKLAEYLMGGQGGSWILVTTRSKETARVIGNGPTYELQGLSEENSWRLFERMTFEPEQELAIPPELVKIGKDIVKKCANVPLAIRVVGSLLYGQEKSKWLSFRETEIANIRRGENGLINILKLSYHHLSSPLKSCFSYCALFPKGFVIYKEKLISLWMAQGYIVPLDKGQSIEDAGEEYFLILLRRCFFQDIQNDAFGEVISCKLHDLMHDVAQDVAGKEICAVKSEASNLDKKIRHICLAESKFIEGFITKTKIRTCLQVGLTDQLPVGTLLAHCKYLRALDLQSSGISHLPCTINLLHLRYLDISRNFDLEELPRSITKLHNLQTMKLSWCNRLKELPKDLNKLVKLRLLDIRGCNGLTYMPLGMGKLRCLHVLSMFVLAAENSSVKQSVVHQLEDLKALTNLKGQLTIRIPNFATYIKESGREGGYLKSKKRLTDIRVTWYNLESGGKVYYGEELMEDLQPHPNLKGLALSGYSGVRLPSWAGHDNLAALLPNLVKIDLVDCHLVQHLPLLGKLRYLKFLKIRYLMSLEYMENTSASSYAAASASGSMAAELSFFPSLEELRLYELPKLKRWWRGVGILDDQPVDNSSRIQSPVLPSFPRLSQLLIFECPELTCIPLCPTVERLTSYKFNGKLRIINMESNRGEAATSSSFYPLSSPSDTENSRHPKLRILHTDNVGCLKSLPIEAFNCITEVKIYGDQELESLAKVGEVFRSISSSLRSLDIFKCRNLSSLSRGLEHLTALETLTIRDAPNLISAEEGEEDGSMPWKSLHHSLHSLEFRVLPKLVNLPKGIQYLAALQSLKIMYCRGMESLPESMQKLTSLRQLEIYGCSAILEERCWNPTGEDWPKIQHIPHILIG